MPRQISKSVAALLVDEEVEVWNALEQYARKRKFPVISQAGTGKVSAQRMLRVILRLAAERVADSIGEDLAKKLVAPRLIIPHWRKAKPARPVPAKPPGRRAAKKPTPKPTRRVHWDRPWREPRGGQ